MHAGPRGIQVHFNRRGATGETLVVVALGADAFGAADADPANALRLAAGRAAAGLALRGRHVDAEEIVEIGLRMLPHDEQ